MKVLITSCVILIGWIWNLWNFPNRGSCYFYQSLFKALLNRKIINSLDTKSVVESRTKRYLPYSYFGKWFYSFIHKFIEKCEPGYGFGAKNAKLIDFAKKKKKMISKHFCFLPIGFNKAYSIRSQLQSQNTNLIEINCRKSYYRIEFNRVMK